jgi:CpXC protein
MTIVGVTRVRCSACDRERECQLVQSINTRTNPSAKTQLLAGELNVLACPCGRRTQLEATVLFHDPDADYWCQVCPGGGQAMAEGEAAFRATGVSGRQRLVPSLNALVEKVKLLDAGLEDWAIEMAKVLLLASREDRDLERVLLFQGLDGDTIHWVMFEESGARIVASSIGAYRKLAARTQARPALHELQIDRAWAIEAVRTMIADAN